MESFQPGMNFNPVKRAEIVSQWVVPEKIHTPPRRKFLPSGGGGEKKLFLIITSYFLCGGGMDVFWNDPITWQVRPT
jgi:hypothetical protein